MTPAQVALAATALLVCARADLTDKQHKVIHNERGRAGNLDPESGCLYDGRWYSDGSTVLTREDCLRCVCAHGALSCRRRACAPMPDPLPRRCHVRHRRGSCCPELHCPDGVTVMEHGAAARFESEDFSDIATPSSASHACVEGGVVFAAGSALGSRVACEQCFCLRGARRCVRPSCLAPPPHCAPRPAPGACCPQRYYCHAVTVKPEETLKHHTHDCKVEGNWVSEGDSVATGGNCTSCFCLRGEVRCQAPGCAPPLGGCRPLLAPGHCCAHQYVCEHNHQGFQSLTPLTLPLADTSLASTRYDDRAFHLSKQSKLETTTKNTLTSIYTVKNTPIASATKNHLITTTKVKRKTNEPSLSSSQKPEHTSSSTTPNITTTQKPFVAAKFTTAESMSSTEVFTERTTEQPEGTVKIMINGTINCTAELSSTSLPLSINLSDTDKIQMEALPRVPIVNIEAQTYSPNDIITDRSVNGGFDENDTFTINVTSSLMTNTSRSTSRPVIAKVPSEVVDTLNSSKKTKGDYDYDYTEPTLPPSLPNLKIIPFVAADAVVDDESTKDAIYPILDREDKFPVYYPSAGTKDTAIPTRREDTYNPTQYPIFISEKVEPSYPATHDIDLNSNRFPVQNELGVHEYTVSTSLGSKLSDAKAVTNVPTTSSTFKLETPAMNLFSPPVETEGGFIPKSPGIIDEYYAVYPSTPSGPAVPHLTTSMQLDIAKSECVSSDGRHVAEGESISVGCLQCRCTWLQLSCAPRVCRAAPGCVRRPPAAHSPDPCCGDLVCDSDNKTTSTPKTVEQENKINETKVEMKTKTTTVRPVTFTVTNITNTAVVTNVTTQKPSIKNITVHTNNVTKPPTSSEPMQETTSAAPTTKAKPVPKFTTTTTTPAPSKEINDTSQEYEDDDDEGFSFGSVLKLLLSDSYESTTTAPLKKPSTKPPVKQTPPSTTSIRRPTTVAPFIPLPPHPYIPSKMSPNTVNRIDHLVLGEATAIKRTTPKPITNKTTKRPTQRTTTESRPEKEEAGPFTPVTHEGPRPPNVFPGGAGLLKLAGCNIYGRMYRVGRIIAELSTPCQECWCTDLGVQCKPLHC